MNFYQQTQLKNWKVLTDEEKKEVFRQVLMYFVNPLLEIRHIRLKDFALCGMRCRTFELEILGEQFVFVPGQTDTILGWDNGAEGLKLQELFGLYDGNEDSQQYSDDSLTEESLEKLQKENAEKGDYDFSSLEELSAYINDFTTDLRKVDLPACLVAKKAIPVGTKLQGEFDLITGSFEGNNDFYETHQTALHKILLPQLTLAESLKWNAPESYLGENQFYFEMIAATDRYRLYSHQSTTFEGVRHELDKIGFDLMDEDLWEYVVGGGTRRLFRWGNEISMNPFSNKENAYSLSQVENMFGLLIDNLSGSFELTKKNQCLKLGPRVLTNIPIQNVLPFSTYYQSHSIPAKDEVLLPELYTYRKVILIEP